MWRLKGLVNSLLENCKVCPRNCRVNRLRNEEGFCRMGADLVVSSFGPHFGEEDVLVGTAGSGTIFLTGCNLGCIFCQNYEISHLRSGRPASKEEFVEMMLSLQKGGCHNINFVTPTHFIPQILEAIIIAKEKGLKIPLVYNSGGYDSTETLKFLEGIIDIYMPDAKYSDAEVSQKLSSAKDYPIVLKKALKQMHRQVGNLTVNREGLATKGLIVRHLVLPNGLAGTREIMQFIAEEISKETYLNIMDQYRPCYKAVNHTEINRPITYREFEEAKEIARSYGLHRGF